MTEGYAIKLPVPGRGRHPLVAKASSRIDEKIQCDASFDLVAGKFLNIALLRFDPRENRPAISIAYATGGHAHSLRSAR